MGSDTRDRMIASTAVLIREHGATATSLDRILAHSGAPRGSVYHHFPGGRAELVQAATRFAGDYVTDQIRRMAAAPTASQAVQAFIDGWRRRLTESDFGAGCPVIAVAVEHDADTQPLIAAAGDAMRDWQTALTTVLASYGIPTERAGSLAALVIAAVEGAVVVCRARRSLDPLDDVAAELTRLIDGATEEIR